MPELTITIRQLLCGAFILFAASTAVSAQLLEPLKVYDEWGGEFSLTDHNGFQLSLSDFQGKIVIINFGYTHCPDVCPTTLFTLKRTVKALAADADKVQVLFITLDPERDSAERLQRYMEHFSPGFIALRGSVQEVSQVASQFGTRFEKEDFDEEGNYSIAHTAVVYLLDQAGRIRAFYKTTAPANHIATDVRRLLIENK